MGGGGGAAGSATTNANDGNYAVSLGLGGSGSAGGTGGTVTVTASGPLNTAGAQADGIFAQSVGGGGGVAGSDDSTAAGGGKASIGLALGGSGGSAQTGGGVSLTANGPVTTQGLEAAGIFAQSVGGGGGVGGASQTSASSSADSLGFALGGSGNGGGNGGSVSVTSTALVTTSGLLSPGIVAQSVGGGGGTGGFASAGGGTPTISFGSDGNSTQASVNASLGGSGGNGGNGATVWVSSTGGITTMGHQSIALLAQSIGGGGGMAGAAVAGSTPVISGLLALCGSGGSGGSVSVTQNGIVTTNAGMSQGIVAQSVGGGGGLASMVSAAVMLGEAAGGAGGTVSVTTKGNSEIQTSGKEAVGLIAQSVGGGGGIASANGIATLGGGSGAGSAVMVTSNGSVSTSGGNAIGILAQSVGGGGGIVLSPTASVAGSLTAGSGSGGDVTVTVNGPVSTTGTGSDAIVAESVTDGGGLYQNGQNLVMGSGTGDSGTSSSTGVVTVTVASGVKVSATGSGATGIAAWSNTDPTVTVGTSAAVIGGTGGTGIALDGPANTLYNSGTVMTVDGASGMAVTSNLGPANLYNLGTIEGSLNLTPGAPNLLDNLAGGTLLAGSDLNLGGTGTFYNEGILQQASASLGQTAINGSLLQTGTGTLVVRLGEVQGQSDVYAVSGQTALNGRLQPVITDLPFLVQGTRQNAVVTGLGPVSSQGLTIFAPKSVILGFSLADMGNGLTLTTTADFMPFGLSGRAETIGRTVADIQARGSSPLFQAILPSLAVQPTVQALDVDYRTLSADMASAVPQSTMEATNLAISTMTDQLDAWRIRDVTGHLTGAVSGGGPHIWATPTVMTASGSGTYASHVYGGDGGAEGQVHGTSLLLGGAISGEQSLFSTSSPSASGTATNIGASIYALNPIGQGYVSGILYGGGGSTTFYHNLTTTDGTYVPSVDLSNVMVAGRIEAGYRLHLLNTPAHVTPFLAIQPMQLWQGGGNESVAPYGNTLIYEQTSITALPAYLGVQFDGRFILGNGATLAPFLRLAWMHDFLPGRNVPRAFAAAPDLTFTGTGTPVVDNAAMLHLGTEYDLDPHVSLNASIDSELSPSYTSLAATGGLVYRW